jgi:hypothetical protein
MKLENKPEVGEVYYIPGYFKGVDKVIWNDDIVDNHLFKLGICYSTKEEVESSVFSKRNR